MTTPPSMQRLRRSAAPSLVALALLLASCGAATYDTHDDLTISTQVKIALIADARLGAFRINAATAQGVVTLLGDVPSQSDVDRAIAIARQVRGVKHVKSELKVGQQPVASNQ